MLTETQLKMAQGWWQHRPQFQSDIWLNHDACALHKEQRGEVQADDFEEYVNPVMAAALADALNSLLGRVNRKLTDLEVFAAELIPTVMPDHDVPDWVDELADVSRSHISATLAENGTRAIRGVGVEASFDLINRRAQNYLDNASRKIGRQATNTFREQIRGELIQGVDAGESVKEISKRIQGIKDGGFTKARADRIARTETAFASTNGTEQGWIQSGVVQGKMFVLAPDACPWCQAVASELGDGREENSKVFPLGQPIFDVGKEIEGTFMDREGNEIKRTMVLDYQPIEGAGLSVPPVHPNCRCSTRPVVGDL